MPDTLDLDDDRVRAAEVSIEGDLPVIRVPAGTPAIPPVMVRQARDED